MARQDRLEVAHGQLPQCGVVDDLRAELSVEYLMAAPQLGVLGWP